MPNLFLCFLEFIRTIWRAISKRTSRCASVLYRSFLQVLYRYPEFCFVIDIQEWFLDHLIDHYPEDMTMLGEMVITRRWGRRALPTGKHPAHEPFLYC